MKKVTHTAGITHVANFDAVFAIDSGSEQQLSIPFRTWHVVAIGDFMSVRTSDAEDGIKIRSKTPCEDFHIHTLASSHCDSEES